MGESRYETRSYSGKRTHDRKCLHEPRKAFVGLPNANLFGHFLVIEFFNRHRRFHSEPRQRQFHLGKHRTCSDSCRDLSMGHHGAFPSCIQHHPRLSEPGRRASGRGENANPVRVRLAVFADVDLLRCDGQTAASHEIPKIVDAVQHIRVLLIDVREGFGINECDRRLFVEGLAPIRLTFAHISNTDEGRFIPAHNNFIALNRSRSRVVFLMCRTFTARFPANEWSGFALSYK